MKKIACALILIAIVLSGCSTVGEKSPDKLCTGTKKPYQVKGTWYNPQDHYDYEETGIASWYGPRFHGRPKSCGETFNMHGISAAHKTLPIPSVVQVTNTRTGKNVKLLVDDRGPFVDDRIIDLSKGAATYLGLCNRGLGEVHVKCLPEESKSFANFVAQYGRYGRDPNGRTWETIFRHEFDRDGHTPVPQPGKFVSPRRKEHPRHTKPKGSHPQKQPFKRPEAKPIPVSRKANKPIHRKSEDNIDQWLDAEAY